MKTLLAHIAPAFIAACHSPDSRTPAYQRERIKVAAWMTFCCCCSLFFPLFMQNFLRCQNNKTNYNLVCETLQFLDCICGSTTGGLGLLGLYINEKNVALINQTLESLTEYCQGPCHENQVILFILWDESKTYTFLKRLTKDIKTLPVALRELLRQELLLQQGRHFRATSSQSRTWPWPSEYKVDLVFLAQSCLNQMSNCNWLLGVSKKVGMKAVPESCDIF